MGMGISEESFPLPGTAAALALQRRGQGGSKELCQPKAPQLLQHPRALLGLQAPIPWEGGIFLALQPRASLLPQVGKATQAGTAQGGAETEENHLALLN